MPKTIPEQGHIPSYHEPLNNLQTAIRLLTRGAAQILVEQHNIPQPEADITVLQALVCELDTQVDLPTLHFGPVLEAIRISVENDYADVLADALNEPTDSALNFDLSKSGTS